MKDWIPLIQTVVETGLPLLFGTFVVLLFWKKVLLIVDALVLRIQAGAPLKIGSVDIGAAPEAVKSGEARSATSEGAHGVSTPEEIKSALQQRQYPPEITDELYLVHSVQEIKPYRGPRTGEWLVRAYVEAYEDDSLLDEIIRVTYRLHDSFGENVLTTEAREKEFELWINIYGEFNLIAHVERKNKPALWLTRYLDLPGRPTN